MTSEHRPTPSRGTGLFLPAPATAPDIERPGPELPTAGAKAPLRPAAPPPGPPLPPARPAVVPPRPASPPARPSSGPAVPPLPALPPAAPPAPPVPPRPAFAPLRAPHSTVPPGSSFGPPAPPRSARVRHAGRTAAVAACAVLGFGLVGGALTGVWLAAAEPGKPAEPAGYAEARDLWHDVPVDTLFPRTLTGPHAGPGSAARAWTRIVVAPDAPCSSTTLARGLLATVEPLGCERVLRATYTDATASSVITVGLVFTRADATAQRTLGQGLTARLGQDVPPALPGPGTVAARFGDRQRASWWTSAPADLPVVVTAVSGFADGRTVDAPQPADRAMAKGRTDAVAQSGLGHEAKGIVQRLEGLLRTTADTATKEKSR